MMTREEYERRMVAEDDWAPGWEAVEAPFEALYPGVTPPHLATLMTARAMFGGQEYLDGGSFYPSPHGFQHIVTFGMSSLYGDLESFGGQFSGWGYEMTAKVAGTSADEAHWMLSSMGHLARYTYTSKRWFEPFQTIGGRDEPLKVGSNTALTGYLVVPDTQIAGVDTVHGRLDFLQLVGITSDEWTWVSQDPAQAHDRGRELADRLSAAAGNPWLATDLSRVSVL